MEQAGKQIKQRGGWMMVLGIMQILGGYYSLRFRIFC